MWHVSGATGVLVKSSGGSATTFLFFFGLHTNSPWPGQAGTALCDWGMLRFSSWLFGSVGGSSNVVVETEAQPGRFMDMRSYNADTDTRDLPCGAGTPRGRSLQPCKPLQGCEVVEPKAMLMSCCAPFQLQDMHRLKV